MELSALAAQAHPALSADTVHRALLEREALGSTGFEHGVAIPHAKISGLDQFVLILARSPRGVRFDAHDGKKSHLFFVILGPAEAASEHLKILAQISRVTRQEGARAALMNACDPTDFKEIFVRYAEPGLAAAPSKKGAMKLLVLVLTETRLFEDVIQLFIERGVRGVTVLDSGGIRQQLRTIPLFSSFLDFLGEHSDVSKTLMAVLPEEEIKVLVSGVEALTGDLDNHTGAMVMALDLSFFKGSMES